ncbi:hypothetical protein E4U21_005959 [Claviceps maximensis]|nr:hypothetical protein E4U21_005959 [Claviceps maximensis]
MANSPPETVRQRDESLPNIQDKEASDLQLIKPSPPYHSDLRIRNIPQNQLIKLLDMPEKKTKEETIKEDAARTATGYAPCKNTGPTSHPVQWQGRNATEQGAASSPTLGYAENDNNNSGGKK